MRRVLLILASVQVLWACSGTKLAGSSKSKDAGGSTVSVDQPEPEHSDGEKKSEDSIADAPVPVAGSYLVCAAEYQEDPTQPSYGCRLASAGRTVAVPPTATAELTFSVNNIKVASTTTAAPAGSPWQWITKTTATGLLTAQLILRNVNITNPPLVITAGSGSYIFEPTTVEGSGLTLVPNGGTLNLFSNGQTFRTPAEPANGAPPSNLNFTTAFPKYMTVNRETARKVPLLLAFVIGTDHLTCRYFATPDVPTKYAIDLKTCRKGPAQLTPLGGNNSASDQDNLSIAMSLDTLVVGATRVYTDMAVTTNAEDPGIEFGMNNPASLFTPKITLREFKMP